MSRMYFVKKETIYRCYFIARCYNIITSKLFYRHEEVVIVLRLPWLYGHWVHIVAQTICLIHPETHETTYQYVGEAISWSAKWLAVLIFCCIVNLKTSYMLNNRFRIVTPREILCFVVIVKFSLLKRVD